jgi:uncharacterized membrane protein
LAIGSVLCALPLLSYLLFGSTAFNELHTSVLTVVSLYIIGGLVAGGLVGIVMPIIRSDFMAGLVGSVVGILGSLAMQIMDTSVKAWTFDSVATVLVLGIGLGGSLGIAYRRGSNVTPGDGPVKNEPK